MCSVVISLVTSLLFKPTRCATTLCHFGRTRNFHVATLFILLSYTARSSATSAYVVVPERFGQNEKPANRYEERTKKKLKFFPSSWFSWCNKQTHVNMNFYPSFLCLLFIFGAFYSIIFLWKILLAFCSCFFYCVGVGITILMPIADGINPYLFRRKLE